MLSEPVKALFESNTNARHAGDADRLAKEHKPNGVHVLTDLPYGIPDQLRKLDSKANYTMRLTQLSGRMSTRMTMAWIRMLCF